MVSCLVIHLQRAGIPVSPLGLTDCARVCSSTRTSANSASTISRAPQASRVTSAIATPRQLQRCGLISDARTLTFRHTPPASWGNSSRCAGSRQLACASNYTTDAVSASKSCSVQGYAGDEQLAESLQGCDLVIIPAGMPRKPGMLRDDLFKFNASIVQVRPARPHP